MQLLKPERRKTTSLQTNFFQCIDAASLVTQMFFFFPCVNRSLCATAGYCSRVSKEGSKGSKCTLNTGMLGWIGREGDKGKRRIVEMLTKLLHIKSSKERLSAIKEKRLKERKKLDKTQLKLLLFLPSLKKRKSLNQQKDRKRGGEE